MEYIDTWQFLAGLGIFLFGMRYIEEALKNLAGRPFKQFLRRYTRNPVQGILSGTVITALLQSSSVVTLMVLAFVGAEIITLRNALGVIFGSNLGTTFTGWVVASLGFKLEIAAFALPCLGLGGISMVFLKKAGRLREMGRFLVGFGLLFLGLDYMKLSIADVAEQVDLSLFASWSPYAFFVIGLVLTAIIQSSSAAMVITLSALHAGIIPLESAAAMVIGSDLGTTVTVILGGMHGLPAKKRVALSHFLFNLITDLVALALLFPLLNVLTKGIGMTDPVFILVAFHSTFNLLGILMILPVVGWFARFVESRFRDEEETAARFISKVHANLPEVAIESLQHEIRHMIDRVFLLHLNLFKINTALYRFPDYGHPISGHSGKDYREQYEEIKQLEGEIIEFFLALQHEQLEEALARHLNESIHSVRNAMMAAKAIKDIAHNFLDFEKSVNDSQISLFEWLRGQQNEFYLNLHRAFHSDATAGYFETLADMARMNYKQTELMMKEIYQQAQENKLNEFQISTWLNVNREIFNANRSLILAIKDLVLTGEQAHDFNALPELK